MRFLHLAAATTLTLVACGGGLTVRRTGVTAPPKPRGCDLDVLQKAPPRPHEALAEIQTHVTNVPREGALSIVMPKACELGADAIVVVRNMVLNELGHTLVVVRVIRYRPEAPTPSSSSTPMPTATPAPRADGTPPPAETPSELAR
jgi:hypothetical protein